jgi:MFS family permease
VSEPRRPYLALRHADYRRLAATQLVSLTGSQMQVVALNWHVYLLTHSALALGFVGLTRVAPIILFSLWGGLVADRRDRRFVMMAAQSAMALVSGALAFGAFEHLDSVAVLYALNALQAAAAAFDNPARQALIPRLVSREDLPGALALNLTAFHVAMIVGPALAGGMIAGAGLSGWNETSRLGLLYSLNALSFLGVIVTLGTMRTSGAPDPAAGPAESPRESLRVGLRFVFTTPIMVWTMGLDFFATFFAGSMSLLPIFADQVLGVGGHGGFVLAGGQLVSVVVPDHPAVLVPHPAHQHLLRYPRIR